MSIDDYFEDKFPKYIRSSEDDWEDVGDALGAGNSQTSAGFHFIVLLNQWKYKLPFELLDYPTFKKNCSMETMLKNYPAPDSGEGIPSSGQGGSKVTIGGLDYAPGAYELTTCAAIFIDPECGRGGPASTEDGIRTLERICGLLDGHKRRDIPILYVTHGKSLSDAQRERITGLGAVLVNGLVFPKVCHTQEQYDKELEMARVLAGNGRLQRYSVRACEAEGEQPESEGGRRVLCTRRVFSKRNETVYSEMKSYLNFASWVDRILNDPDRERDALFKALELEKSDVNRKMYVLSLLHSELKGEIENEKLRATSRDFYSIDEIAGRAPQHAAQIAPMRGMYAHILEKHRSMRPRVLTHNDAKWDNWLNTDVMTDFGSVQPGMEYKDIAKALLDPRGGFAATLDRRKVDAAIDAYMMIRMHEEGKSPEFIKKVFMEGCNSCRAEFRAGVYEMMVTESLRTVYYKAKNKKLADGLMKVAQMYAGILKEEYAEYGGIS